MSRKEKIYYVFFAVSLSSSGFWFSMWQWLIQRYVTEKESPPFSGLKSHSERDYRLLPVSAAKSLSGKNKPRGVPECILVDESGSFVWYHNRRNPRHCLPLVSQISTETKGKSLYSTGGSLFITPHSISSRLSSAVSSDWTALPGLDPPQSHLPLCSPDSSPVSPSLRSCWCYVGGRG